MVNFEYQSSEKTLTCIFSGRLDTMACETLGTTISGKLGSLPKTSDPTPLIEDQVVFEMKEISFISSSFIRICIQTVKQVQKGKFSVVNCDPFIKKAFGIAGLEELLKVS